MNRIEFDEKDLGNMEELTRRLFDQAPSTDDPRSIYYKRELVRPVIKWWRVILWCVLLVAVPTAVAMAGHALSWKTGWCVSAALAATLVYVILFLKPLCLTLVRLYQRFAPESIRRKCRFEPSCSQYMILAIEKYGVCKGVYKGIGRLRRCNIHHGGFDEP